MQKMKTKGKLHSVWKLGNIIYSKINKKYYFVFLEGKKWGDWNEMIFSFPPVLGGRGGYVGFSSGL